MPDLMTDAAICARYSVNGITPEAVAQPNTALELAEHTRALSAQRRVMVPFGGGTHQAIGCAPHAPFTAISTQNLKRVLIYEPADMTISVEAGMTFAELDAILKANNQVLPMDVPLPARCTVGGAVAVAADGARRTAYGTLRDVLLGVSAVEADGRISKAGGMTVKNVSGYDMMKLYHGSFGTLTILTSVNFKVLPRPLAAATVRCEFGTVDAAFDLVDRMHESQLTPAAVELIFDQRFTRYDSDQSAVTRNTSIEIAVCAEGIPQSVERHVRDVPTFAKHASATNVTILRDEQHTSFWERVADLPQVAETPDDKLCLKLTCLPADLRRALNAAQQHANANGVRLAMNARALNGGAYIRARGESNALIAFWRALSAQFPKTIVMSAPPAIKGALSVWGAPPAGIELMRKIKTEFDPHNLLNAGRFVI